MLYIQMMYFPLYMMSPPSLHLHLSTSSVYLTMSFLLLLPIWSPYISIGIHLNRCSLKRHISEQMLVFRSPILGVCMCGGSPYMKTGNRSLDTCQTPSSLPHCQGSSPELLRAAHCTYNVRAAPQNMQYKKKVFERLVLSFTLNSRVLQCAVMLKYVLEAS